MRDFAGHITVSTRTKKSDNAQSNLVKAVTWMAKKSGVRLLPKSRKSREGLGLYFPKPQATANPQPSIE
jgi:hypothetical protein